MLTPLDYCPADNTALADLLRSCGGLLGKELSSQLKPAETDQSEEGESTKEEGVTEETDVGVAVEEEVGVARPVSPDTVSVRSLRPATPTKQSLDGLEFEAQQPLDDSTASHVISPQRPHPLPHQDTQVGEAKVATQHTHTHTDSLAFAFKHTHTSHFTHFWL